MCSLYSKSEYESLFEFKLKVSTMLCKLVIKFGEEDTLFRYESFGGKLPRVDDNGNTDDDDDEVRSCCPLLLFLFPFFTATSTDLTSPLTIGVSNPSVSSLGY